MSKKAPQVDTHFHIWDQARFSYPWPPPPDVPTLRRDVTIEEYEQSRTATPVEYSVFVQVLDDSPEETDWLLSIAEKYPSLKGIVAGLDLTGSQLREQLTKYKATGKVVGVRHLLMFEDEGWILREDVCRGLAVLQDLDMVFDLAVQPGHLIRDAVETVKKFPRLRFVVNHIGMPIMRGTMDAEWKKYMTQLGSYSNVFCKISGLVSAADPDTWKGEDFREHVEHALQCFGVDRCMFGSDWPIGLGLVGATYKEVYELAHTLLAHLSPEDKDKFFGLNAIRVYKLDVQV